MRIHLWDFFQFVLSWQSCTLRKWYRSFTYSWSIWYFLNLSCVFTSCFFFVFFFTIISAFLSAPNSPHSSSDNFYKLSKFITGGIFLWSFPSCKSTHDLWISSISKFLSFTQNLHSCKLWCWDSFVTSTGFPALTRIGSTWRTCCKMPAPVLKFLGWLHL